MFLWRVPPALDCSNTSCIFVTICTLLLEQTLRRPFISQFETQPNIKPYSE